MLLTIVESLFEPDIALIDMRGKLALGRESQRVESLVDAMAKDGRTKAIFDMTGVDYIDSAGIGLLALASGKLKHAGGTLVVVAPAGGRVQQMLSLTQMDSLVPVRGTVIEALDVFGETFPPAAA